MMHAGIVDRQSGPLGHIFRIRLAAELLHELGRHGTHPAHRVDHVDRQPDRAALVGNRPRDRLANPPRGVGRELVSALVFELVDGPHQAGVAFLDQVQEAQAAIAIPFGDRHDQPQVGGREHSLGLIVLVALFERASGQVGQRGGGFQRDPHQVAEFLDEFGVLLFADQFRRLGKLLLDRRPSARRSCGAGPTSASACPSEGSALRPVARPCRGGSPAGAMRRASRPWSARLSIAMRKSTWFNRIRCLIVVRLGASRLSVRFFSEVLVTEISIVRSSRNSPF